MRSTVRVAMGIAAVVACSKKEPPAVIAPSTSAPPASTLPSTTTSTPTPTPTPTSTSTSTPTSTPTPGSDSGSRGCKMDADCAALDAGSGRAAECDNGTHACTAVAVDQIKCGGFIANQHRCPDGWTCQTPRIPDVPGKCVK